MIRARLPLALLVLLLPAPAAHAAAQTAAPDLSAVPPGLRDWAPWVLRDSDEQLCPWLSTAAVSHRCAWPGVLRLELQGNGGRFEQSIRTHAEGLVVLPGDGHHWPERVTVDRELVPVVDRKGRPAVRLGPGEHELGGRFTWTRLPETLALPADLGVLALSVDGQPVAVPRLEADGRLLLARGAGAEEAEPTVVDRLEVTVHRRLADGAPAVLESRIQLDVAGRAREVLLARALPEGFTAHALRGSLPARLEADGRLRVQVRAGTWELWIQAHRLSPLEETAFPEGPGPWAPNEVWAFQADPAVRVVEVTGVDPVDPRQTALPPPWKSLPTYRLFPGERLRFEMQRRGDEDPAPDWLSLAREAWLDFDGGGWTLRDRLTGTLHRSWRLEMAEPVTLGRASVGGEDQLITRRAGGGSGFEVRVAALDATAESRLDDDAWLLPAVAWAHDFDQVGTTLHLPPGWRLFTARGADRVQTSWMGRWSLLDLFLCSVVVMATLRLRGRAWAVVAAAALAATWTEPGAARWTWLLLLVSLALAELLPAGKPRLLARGAFALVLIGALAIWLPFLLRQARLCLHPALERPGARYFAPDAASVPAALEEAMERGMQKRTTGDVRSLQQYSVRPPAKRPDEAVVQTGPGIPNWNWTRVQVSWSGPVRADQRLRLLLIPPALSRLLAALRCALVIAFAFALLRPRDGDWRRWTSGAGAATAVLLLAIVLPAPAASAADMPSPELLRELKQHLLQRPDCYPGCAELTGLELDAREDRLEMRLGVEALEEVAVPLPGGLGPWRPDRVRVDGAPAFAIAQGDARWVLVSPGRHEIRATGPMPRGAVLRLPLPQRPHRARATSLEGWTIEGIDADGRPDKILQLSRVADGADERPGSPEAADELAPGELPPLLSLTRELRLEITWSVRTILRREGAGGGSAVLEIPLLPGESVTTEGVRVEGGRALVQLPAGATTVSWTSALQTADRLELQAPGAAAWAEIWRLVAWPNWHFATDGIPPVLAEEGQRLRELEWRPWPGESVGVTVEEPEGAGGATLTIDRVGLSLAPGRRATDAVLDLSVRSSRGGRHELGLPPGSELTALTVDGRALPARLENGRVSLPLHPGAQALQVTWRQPEGVTALWRAPRVDLGAPAVNARVEVRLPRDRWLLFTAGPRLGPAVLYWSLLPILLLAAWVLSRLPGPPLRAWQWALLLLGLSQVPVVAAVLVVGWFLFLAWRGSRGSRLPAQAFDLVQVLAVPWTLVMLVVLFAAIHRGLLDRPEMHVEGNGSSAVALQWYADRTDDASTPAATAVSAPLLAYRLLMLAWALWLAASLVKWLRWAYGAFTTGGAWKRLVLRKPKEPEKGEPTVETP